MSTDIATIKNSGRNKVDLEIIQYSGGPKGIMLQLTQGFGSALDEPGYIQLSKDDAEQLVVILNKWLRS